MTEMQRTRSLRRMDVVALIGLVTLTGGAALFKFGAEYVPAWLAWLIAPLLWYSGFGLLVGWAVSRLVGTNRHSAATASSPQVHIPALVPHATGGVEEGRSSHLTSNFIEHDSVIELKEMA